jgi:hypothetical protein
MRADIIRGALLGILLLGFACPGIALAGDGEKNCSNHGTWFGVLDPMEGDMTLTGWTTTVTGQSGNMGVNVIEWPDFDPTLGLAFPPFDQADHISNMRGLWKRTGGKTFVYSFTGFAYNDMNMPVYIAKVSGTVTLLGDCNYEHITAYMEAFAPGDNPFLAEPFFFTPLPDHWGQRAMLDLPF